MSEKRCLYCYKENNSETDFHVACSRKIFGSPVPPELAYTQEDMLEMGNEVIKGRIAITGVQPKLSLQIADRSGVALNPIGLSSRYILKPPTQQYAHLPEIEDLTMHLAEICGIATVPHSLIRLKSGSLAYITQRVDRKGKEKLHMEDMCQLTERLTEYKYNGSYEQIGKAILKYSSNPALDVMIFFEQVLFSFLTGNADMHLKNFSLLKTSEMGYNLCPAYDMVASALLVKDSEELALNLNGKKRKIQRKDFVAAMQLFNISERTVENVFTKFESSIPDWLTFIRLSFLPKEVQDNFVELIKQKTIQLGLKVSA